MRKQFNINKLEILSFIFLIFVFLIIEISFIKLPGPYCDEAAVGNRALNIKNALQENLSIGTILTTNPRLLMADCRGFLDAYIYAFIFYFFPVGVVSLRLMAIFFAVLMIIFTYFFTKEFFNKRYALLAILLLVINPSFIMGAKIGMSCYGIIMNSIYMIILFYLLQWYRSKRNIYFYLAMFLLGLGMWVKIFFFWFIFGIFITAIVFKRDIKQRFGINKITGFLKYVISGVTFFILGCVPVLYGVSALNFNIVKRVFAGLKNPSLWSGQHNNLQYFRNFSIVVNNFSNILTGNFYFMHQFGDQSRKFINNFYPWVFLISIGYLFIFAIFKRNLTYRKNILFILVLFSGMFILTPISYTHLPWYHLYFFHPLIQLIIAVAIVNSAEYFKKIKIIIIMIAIFLILFIGKELNGIRGYFYHLKKTGGKLYFSSAIYDLTDYLLKTKRSNIIIPSWGLQNIIDITSGGLIRTQQIWHIGDWEPFLKDKNALYIFYPKEHSNTMFNNLDDFLATAKKLNLTLVEEKRFYEKDGEPVYIVMHQKK